MIIVSILSLGMSAGAKTKAGVASKPTSSYGSSDIPLLGAGLIVGAPTGLTAKYWLSRTYAVNASIGFGGSTSIHGDFIYQRLNEPTIDKIELNWYVGAGARVVFGSKDTELGIRIPVGIFYRFENFHDVDPFFELVPLMNLSPKSEFSLQAAIGARFYFL